MIILVGRILDWVLSVCWDFCSIVARWLDSLNWVSDGCGFSDWVLIQLPDLVGGDQIWIFAPCHPAGLLPACRLSSWMLLWWVSDGWGPFN